MRERSSLVRSSSSGMISAAPLRSAVSCSSTDRNVCGAVIDDEVTLVALRALGQALLPGFFGGGQDATACDAEFAREHKANCLRVNAMLFAQNARGESFIGIAGLNGNDSLLDDCARVAG